MAQTENVNENDQIQSKDRNNTISQSETGDKDTYTHYTIQIFDSTIESDTDLPVFRKHISMQISCYSTQLSC